MKRIEILFWVVIGVLCIIGVFYLHTEWNDYVEERTRQVETRMERIVDKLERNYFCFNLHREVELDKAQGLWFVQEKNERLDTLTDFIIEYGNDTAEYSFPKNGYQGKTNIGIHLAAEFVPNKTDTLLSDFDQWVKDTYATYWYDTTKDIRLVQPEVVKKYLTEELPSHTLGIISFGITRDRQLIRQYIIKDTTASQAIFEVAMFNKLHPQQHYALQLSVAEAPYAMATVLFPDYAIILFIVLSLVLIFQVFKRQLKALETLNTTRQNLMYAIGHEFNTPLSNINLSLQLLRHKDMPADTAEQIDIIDAESQRLQNVARSLLNQPEMDLTEISNLDINDLLTALTEENSNAFKKEGGSIEFEGSTAQVKGNPFALKLAFQNVIDNTLKYAGEQPPHLEIKMSLKTDTVSIDFEDKGIGISKDEAKSVFNLFYRGKGRDISHPGIGAGLYVLKEIVAKCGGKVMAFPHKKEGLTVRVQLPIKHD